MARSSTRASPSTIGMAHSAAAGSASDLTMISGPMPAASPIVIATRGRCSIALTSAWFRQDRDRRVRRAARQDETVHVLDAVEHFLPRAGVAQRPLSGAAQTRARGRVFEQPDD